MGNIEVAFPSIPDDNMGDPQPGDVDKRPTKKNKNKIQLGNKYVLRQNSKISFKNISSDTNISSYFEHDGCHWISMEISHH